jgi:phosphoglycolate phosphatase
VSRTLVLFDVDGTLVDSQHLLYAVHLDTFAALGLKPPAREEVLSLVGLSLPVLFASLVGPDGPVERLEAEYRARYVARVSAPDYRETPFPGASDTLRRLAGRGDMAVGLATGKSRRGVARILESQGWGPLLDTIQTADDAPSKPHPGMVLQAIAETGADPGETWVVGDTTFDMDMARAAGARAIGVSWGHHSPDALLASGAVRVVRSFGELWP